MISLKSPREIDAMEKAGAALAAMHLGLRKIIKPGISSWKIEEFARKYFKAAGAKAEQIGFEGYKYATCVSVNDEICHGFPRKKLILKKGDLVKVDTVVSVDGAFSDSCWSYAVGEVSPEIQKLMDVTKKSLFMGIDQCVLAIVCCSVSISRIICSIRCFCTAIFYAVFPLIISSTKSHSRCIFFSSRIFPCIITTTKRSVAYCLFSS